MTTAGKMTTASGLVVDVEVVEKHEREARRHRAQSDQCFTWGLLSTILAHQVDGWLYAANVVMSLVWFAIALSHMFVARKWERRP